MATPRAARGLRLTTLLRRFGLGPSDVAGQPSKAVVSTLKAEYFRQAKEQHPDHTVDDRKADAAERFVQLNREFQEAVKLLEDGVRPFEAEGDNSRKDSFAIPLHQYRYGTPFKHSEPQTFDLATRVKGHVIVWSSLFMFFMGFREFLVWSAGSTYAWTKPQKQNEFYVRRYSDDWEADKEEAMKVQEKAKSYVKPPQRLDRGVDKFYQKRGISNVRRKTEPRGFGSSL